MPCELAGGSIPTGDSACAVLLARGLFVEECFIDLSEVVETQCPFACLVKCGDAGQFQRQCVDRLARVGAWLGRRVATDRALGMD